MKKKKSKRYCVSTHSPSKCIVVVCAFQVRINDKNVHSGLNSIFDTCYVYLLSTILQYKSSQTRKKKKTNEC